MTGQKEEKKEKEKEEKEKKEEKEEKEEKEDREEKEKKEDRGVFSNWDQNAAASAPAHSCPTPSARCNAKPKAVKKTQRQDLGFDQTQHTNTICLRPNSETIRLPIISNDSLLKGAAQATASDKVDPSYTLVVQYLNSIVYLHCFYRRTTLHSHNLVCGSY